MATRHQPRQKVHKMNKLIDNFKRLPSPINRAKLQNYLNNHAMAICLATPDQIAFLTVNEFEM